MYILSIFKSSEITLINGDYKAPWDNGTGVTTGLSKTVSGARGLRLPKLWKRKWNHSIAEQEAPSHSDTAWCLIVFLTSRGKVHTSCLPRVGVSGPNQRQRPREYQGRTGSVSQRLEGRLLASQGSPAGNPALYPGWISLDCKIYTALWCNLRAFEKERKGVGRGALNGGKYFYLYCYHFGEKPGRLKGLPRLENSSS